MLFLFFAELGVIGFGEKIAEMKEKPIHKIAAPNAKRRSEIKISIGLLSSGLFSRVLYFILLWGRLVRVEIRVKVLKGGFGSADISLLDITN